jgi:hypothetical protein
MHKKTRKCSVFIALLCSKQLCICGQIEVQGLIDIDAVLAVGFVPNNNGLARAIENLNVNHKC